MLYVGFAILVILNLIFAIRKRHSKFVFFLSFVFLWILIAGNTHNPDLQAYKNIYYGDNRSIELGFVLLTKLFRNMNISFEAFVAIISFFCLVMTFTTIKLYTKNLNLVMGLYMIYPFVIDAIQLRNFIATSIVIFSIRYLLRNNLKNKLKYVFFIILAGMMHQLFFFYLLFLLIDIKKRNTKIKVIVGSSLLFSVLVFLNGNSIPLLDQILPISPEKYRRYFSTKLRYGFLINWSFNLLYLFLINLSKKRVSQNKNELDVSNIERYITLVFWINVVTVVFFPLYMLNVNFYRLYRNISLINYSVYAIAIDIIVGNKGKGWALLKFMSIILFSVLLLFVYDIGPGFDRVFRAIMENNILIGK